MLLFSLSGISAENEVENGEKKGQLKSDVQEELIKFEITIMKNRRTNRKFRKLYLCHWPNRSG